MGGVSPGGHDSPALSSRTEIGLAHQPGHPFARDASPLLTQLDVETRTAISALMSTKPLSKLFCELGIFSRVLADRALQPGVIATLVYSEHTAHDHNRKFLLILFNELISHLDSREKMPTAFFNISRSCRKSSFSRFRRRFSSSIWV